MRCKSLLLPLMAGLTLSAVNVPARGGVFTQENLASRSLSFIENKGQIVNQNQEARPDIDFKLAAGNGLNIFIGDGQVHYQWAMVRRAHHDMPFQAQGDILRQAQDDNSGVVVRQAHHDMTKQAQGDNSIDVVVRQAHHDMTKQAQGDMSSQIQGDILRSRTSGTGEAQDDNRRDQGGSIGVALRRAQGDIPKPQDDSAVDMYRMDVKLLGANPNAQLITARKQDFYERYYTSQFGMGGAVANSYRSITYKDIYPHIDWVWYVKGNTVEYDFVVHPEGKVSDIKIKYGGATGLKVKSDGSFETSTPMGVISERAPYSFQEDGKLVASRFVLNGNTLSFETNDYTGTLTIDPTLEWGTYFGDLGSESSYAVASDASGNVYIGGSTGSLNNIATSGAYQSVFGGSPAGGIMGDAYIARFDLDGNCLWATYYGSNDEDGGLSISVDPTSRFVYLAGNTKSISGIATTGSFQPSPGGGQDAFLVKFDTSGQRVWSTFYGGTGNEATSYLSLGTACDAEGNVFLIGDCNSPSGISTPGSYQPTTGGGKDAFVVKFDSSGQRQWGTYFGGAVDDYGIKASCDANGNLFLGGYTNSLSGIATPSAYQAVFSGANDAFLAKFNTSGGLEWSTYFGGTAFEQLTNIKASGDGRVYIAGITLSTTGISTVGSHQPVFGGGYSDAYLAQFDTTGQLNWATYYGGTDLENAGGLVCAPNNDVILGGVTASADGIATPGSYQDTLNNADAFIACFDHSGQRKWGTYYGGSDVEYIDAATIDDLSRLTVTGHTNSAANVATSGSYQANFGGGAYDAFLVQFNACEQPQSPDNITGDTLLCSGQEYVFNIDSVAGAVSYTWTMPNGWAGNSDSTSITIIPDENSGVLSVVANNSCATSDSVSLNLTVNVSPEPEIENNNNTLSTTQPYNSYQWNKDGQAISGATAATYTAATDGSYSVTVTNANGCSGTSDTITLEGVGIDELQMIRDAIRIYPNPAEDVVFIQSPVSVNVEVMDIEGRVLKAVAHAETIRLGELTEGMYLLRIYDGEGRLVKVEKIIKRLK